VPPENAIPEPWSTIVPFSIVPLDVSVSVPSAVPVPTFNVVPLSFSVVCLEGKKSQNRAAATPAGNAAHSLAFAVRRLAEYGIAPESELAYLQHVVERTGLDRKHLQVSVRNRIAAIGRGEAWPGPGANDGELPGQGAAEL